MPHLFVYGTLRRPVGGPVEDTKFHARISDHIVSAEAAVLSGALLYDLGTFPGVVPGDGSVVGEVFEISEHALLEADVVEGHPDYYERRREEVTVSNGSNARAWVYWAPDRLIANRPVVSSGDWFDRERQAVDPDAANELQGILERVDLHDQAGSAES